MSTHNKGFYEDLTKIISELSSNIIKYAPYFFCCMKFLTWLQGGTVNIRGTEQTAQMCGCW